MAEILGIKKESDPVLSLNVLLMGALAGFTIFLGLPVARLRAASPLLKNTLNAIAIGILIFLVLDVVGHGWESVEGAATAAFRHTASWAPAIGLVVIFTEGLTFGLLSLVWFENRFLHARTVDGAPINPQHVAMMIAIGIGLHNFSEGLAIGASAASGALTFAIILAIGFGLHNATEGFGIAAPLSGTRPSWGFIGVAGLVGGGPTFVGTLLGSIYTNTYLEVLFLSLAAGALIYVIRELLHHGRKVAVPAHSYFVLGGIALGVMLGLGTDLVVTLGGA
ncbi:MAG: ZIP family metal transporter [Thermoplasmatota archaeon]